MDDIIKELGLEAISQEEKDKVLVQIAESLSKRLILRAHDRLSESGQKEFDALVTQGDTVKITEFLAEKVPDLGEIRDEELDGLLIEMKEFLAAVKK